MLLRERDVPLHLGGRLPLDDARGELPLVESGDRFLCFRQLLENVVARDLLLVIEQEIVKTPEVRVALLLGAGRGLCRGSGPGVHGERQVPEHQSNLGRFLGREILHDRGKPRAVRALEIGEDGQGHRCIRFTARWKVAMGETGVQRLRPLLLLRDGIAVRIHNLPR